MSIKNAANYARHGHTVAWFVMSSSDTGAVRALEEELGDDLERSVRTNGNQHLRTKAGGTIRLIPVRSARIRGMLIDLAILPDWRLIQDQEFMGQLLPAFRDQWNPRIGVEA